MLDSSKMVVVTSEVVGVEEILYESFDSLFGKSWKRLKSTILVQYLFKTILLKIIQNGHLCGQESTWFYSKANLTLTQFDFEPPNSNLFSNFIESFFCMYLTEGKNPSKILLFVLSRKYIHSITLDVGFFFSIWSFQFFWCS